MTCSVDDNTLNSVISSANAQYDEMRYSIMSCKTVSELSLVLKPFIKRVVYDNVDNVDDSCVVINDQMKYDFYCLEKSVYHISRFSMKTIERVVDTVLKENYLCLCGDFCLH